MSSVLSLSAQIIGTSFRADPELALPRLPFFPPELVMLPFGKTGLLFEGAKGTQVIAGRGARGFLPQLIAALDGHTPLDALCKRYRGVPERTILDAIALLYSRGLLEDGAPDPAPMAAAEAAMLAFFGRHVDATRANANRGQARARMGAARVAVAGPGEAAALVRQALENQGLGTLGTAEDLGATGSLVIVAYDASAAPEAEAALRRAWAQGVPALHMRVGHDAIELGPLFMPGQSACPDCFRRIRPAGILTAAAPPTDLGFWAGVAALQAHHTISRIGNPSLYNICHVHQRHPGGTIVETVKLARLPGCDTCGLGHTAPLAGDPHSVVWLLHNAANLMPPRTFHNPRDYQMHYAAANIESAGRPAETWYGAVPHSLPEASLTLGRPAWGLPTLCHDLDAALLATLLRFAAGDRPGEPGRRIAPSAGGLGSTELFLAIRALEGTPAGLYRYDAARHRLDRLGTLPDSLLCSALGVGCDALAPVIVVGTCNTDKMQHKYNDFTFRFAHLDSGFARLVLHDAARARGLQLCEYPDMRDGVLADSFGIPSVGGAYILTFAMGLGAAPPALTPASIAADNYVGQLIELSGRPLRGAAASQTPLAVLPPCGIDLEHLLLGRRSEREYAARPVGEQALCHVALRATEADRALASLGGVDLRMALWAATIGDAQHPVGSVRRFDATTARWHSVRDELRPEDLEAVMLQRTLSRAPLVLLLTADFEHAVGRYGARGYREIIGRAGAMAARALLAAAAEGMVGCPWGGLTEDGWGRLLGIDRYTQCPMFGVSLGYPDHDR